MRIQINEELCDNKLKYRRCEFIKSGELVKINGP